MTERRSLTSLALRASEAVDTGASVGPDASAAVLTAVLTHGWREEEEEDIQRQSHGGGGGLTAHL